MDSVPGLTSPTQWTSGVTWSFQPTSKVDTRYVDRQDGINPSGPSDNLWQVWTSRWTGAYDGRLTLTSGLSDGSWVNTDAFSLHQQAQDTWYVSPLDSASSQLLAQQDLQQDSSLLTQNVTSTWKPWVVGGPWRDSNLQYNLNVNLWQATANTNTYFDGKKRHGHRSPGGEPGGLVPSRRLSDPEGPGGWQTNLPPLDPLKTYTGRFDLGLPWGKAYTTTSAQQTDTAWTFNPWESSVEWDPLTSVLLNETYQYDLQNRWPLIFTTDFQAWGFETKYTHERTTPYDFNFGDPPVGNQRDRSSRISPLPTVFWVHARRSSGGVVALS